MAHIKNVLIIEDDLSLANGISLAFKDSELEFTQSWDIDSAQRQIEQTSFDLIILDLNLPAVPFVDYRELLLQEVRMNPVSQ